MVCGISTFEGARGMRFGFRRASGSRCTLKALLWLLALSLTLGVKPSAATATKQKTVRKDTPKAKAQPVTSSTRRPAKSQARSPFLRQPVLPSLDPSDRREFLVTKARSGDNIGKILTRLQIPQAERSLWERSIRRDIGNRVFPAGKEINLYFAKATVNGRQAPARQLKAIEIDDSESLALTWEIGIRGILFQRREKPCICQ